MSIEQFIDNEVKSNDVVLFMKGTPQFPQCGFSGQVVQILDHIGVCDIIREMFQAGELQQLLADKGVTASAAASA
jgi:monothiol glutaredoxin